MPKQGQFAKSVRQKRLNDFKVKRHDQGTVIDESQLTDFLTVRFALTTKKKLPLTQRESAQRLLQEVVPRLRSFDGQLPDLMAELINELNAKTPWQFFWQLNEFWPLVQRFLQKEVPAVPLKSRILIKQTLDQAALDALLARALAQKIAMAMVLGQGRVDQHKVKQLTDMMIPSLYEGAHLSWIKVRKLLVPFGFVPNDGLNETTRQWLQDLAAL